LNSFRAYAAAKRHFFNSHRMLRAPSQDRAMQSGGEPLLVTHANAPLEVRAWGSGPTVLFVHGLLSNGGAFSSLVPEVVRHGFRAVVFDAPGHGASPGAYACSDEVADAMLSIRSVTGPIAAVVGHSMGSAWALYSQHVGLGAESVVCIALEKMSAALEFYVRHTRLEPAVVEHLVRLLEAFTPHEARSPLSIAAVLHTPGLIVHDREDPLGGFQHAQQLATAWTHSQTLWTDGLGHMDILHDGAVIDGVSAFLRERMGEAHAAKHEKGTMDESQSTQRAHGSSHRS
jgi:pimeloyl-ACP methyl ester carboxylesterase